jgi:hypothetical protein
MWKAAKKPLIILTERLFVVLENTPCMSAACLSQRLRPGLFILPPCFRGRLSLYFLGVAVFAVNGPVSAGLERHFALFLAA